MQIETYEVEEITGEMGIMAADAEAIDLCEKLGLVGQKQLANPDTATRNPYREITAEERAVFEACFPNKTALENYSDGIIPLRVLQLVAHCKSENLFSKFEVWHPQRGQVDPLLVATRTVRPAGWNWDRTDTFLLARWGDALESIDKLREKAKKILTVKWGNKLREARAEVLASDEQLEARIDEHLLGIKAHGEPQFYWQ